MTSSSESVSGILRSARNYTFRFMRGRALVKPTEDAPMHSIWHRNVNGMEGSPQMKCWRPRAH